MRRGVVELAVHLVLSWCFGLGTAAGARSACGSPSSVAESDACSRLERSIETKKKELVYRGMMTVLSTSSQGDYVDLKMDHAGILDDIDALKMCFFEALADSGLYPCFSDEAEILAMSPEDFVKDSGVRYRSHEDVRNADVYRQKFNEYLDERDILASKIAKEKMDNQRYRRETKARLESLGISFDEAVKKMEWYKAKLQRYRDTRDHYETAKSLLHKVLGKKTISILHNSYCDSLRRLQKIKRRYERSVRSRRGGCKNNEASARLRKSVERIRSKLMDRWCKLNISLMVEEDLVEIQSCNFRVAEDVRALENSFFSVLERSKLYIAVDDEEKARILAKSPEDFREDFEEKHAENIRRLRTYKYKARRYSAEVERLRSEIAEKSRAHGQEDVLKPLEDLLGKCRRKWDKYVGRLQECEYARNYYRAIIELPLDKILGRHAVSVFYRSYLDAKRELEEEERRYAELGGRQSAGRGVPGGQ